VELGAGLREYRVGTRHILDGYPAHSAPSGSRGLPLLPWPNRIADGRYRFDGREHQLPITQVAEHNAIHGLTRQAPWLAVEHTVSRVALATAIDPQPGYPFSLSLRVSYELSAAGLTVETTARNDGDGALPYGAGHHPYLAVSGDSLDRATLAVPAAHRLVIGPRGIPTGEVEGVEGTSYDFRRPRPLGALRLDDCYTGLVRDSAGRAWVSFEETQLWVDARYGYLMLFTGESLSAPHERRRGLAVEPMTCPPDAFRRGTGVIVLRPGESVTTRWGIAALAGYHSLRPRGAVRSSRTSVAP
jgi:aldose 1-epimerase